MKKKKRVDDSKSFCCTCFFFISISFTICVESTECRVTIDRRRKREYHEFINNNFFISEHTE